MKSFWRENSEEDLFTYGERKQVAMLPPIDPTSNLSTIKELVNTSFNVLVNQDTSSLNIQIFDDNFREWVDLKDVFIAEHKQRLLISFKNPTEISNLQSNFYM